MSVSPAIQLSAAAWLAGSVRARRRVAIKVCGVAPCLLSAWERKADVVVLGPLAQFSASLLSSHYFADDA
jgi:hypothetical protein